MSALPAEADIAQRDRHVRFVPKADILRCGKGRCSITSSARPSSGNGMQIPSALAAEAKEWAEPDEGPLIIVDEFY